MRVDRTLPAKPESVRQARNAVMAMMIEAACTTGTVEAARLLVSELATNAVLHARSDTFTLTVEIDEPWTRISVHDDDPAIPTTKEVDVAAEGGRGLGLVAELSERWSMEGTRDPEGKTVWFEIACA